MSQYKNYPIERMTTAPSTTTTTSTSIKSGYSSINRPSTLQQQQQTKPSSTRYGQIQSNPKQYSVRSTPSSSSSSSSTVHKPSSSSNVVYKSSTCGGYVPRSSCSSTQRSSRGQISNNNNNNNSYNALATQAKSKQASSKYIRGIVIVTPQNESTHGWIYSKATNMMYQLPFNVHKHYIVDQVVLFTPNSFVQFFYIVTYFLYFICLFCNENAAN